MVKKPDAGKLMYDRAVIDYGREFIDRLVELCKNVRRSENLQEGDERKWKITGLLRDLGNEIEREYDISYP
jgi:hypothetical protein